jgi:hypothetical protein
MLCHAAGTFGGGRFTLFTPLGGSGVAIFLLLSACGLNESWIANSNTGGYDVLEETLHSSAALHGVSSFDAIVAAFRGNAVGALFGVD